MKALSDDLIVRADSTAADGSKLEPEEKLAQRVIGTEASVSLRDQAGNVTPTDDAFTTKITADLTALEAAQILSQSCGRCAFWDRAGWTKTRKAWSDPSNETGFVTLNRIRGELLNAMAASPGMVNGNDVDDVEHALGSDIAICRALSEATREITLTAYNGCCPSNLADGTPFHDSFRAKKGGEAARLTAQTYDKILRAAQGR